jgi:hypothetical protein
MASDLTPAVFGLVGAAVGGIGTSVVGVWVERTRFTRERNVSEADRTRDFRVEALGHLQTCIVEHSVTAADFAGLRKGGVTPSLDAAHALASQYADCKRWTEHIPDPELRAQCHAAIDICSQYAAFGSPDNTVATGQMIDAVNGVQESTGKALRAHYSSDSDSGSRKWCRRVARAIREKLTGRVGRG